MFKLNLKIALRCLWKNKAITAINVGGLSVALATFILVMMYVSYETSFDKAIPNYENIYIVGRKLPEFRTNYTPPPLGKLIKESFSEVVSFGTIKYWGFEFAIVSHANTVFTNYLSVDSGAVKMFDLLPGYASVKPKGQEHLFFLNKENMQTLFPGKNDYKPEMVSLGSSKAGHTGIITGAVINRPNSNIIFDALSVSNQIGENESYGHNNYNTYIQILPGTDISILEQKINAAYKNALVSGGYETNTAEFKQTSIFLDPLKNLHLRPKAGNNTAFRILIVLSALSVLILAIACINFTNLSIAQATKRAKEVGIKKVLGVYRYQLAVQFLIEILIQCLVAAILSLILAELFLPQFNALFNVSLSIWSQKNFFLWQLPLIVIVLAIVAGIYPAMVLSAFKPALVLKGNFFTGRSTYLLRNVLLVIQFSVAVICIIGLLIIGTQLRYMKTQDTGFNPAQVVFIKNIAIFNDPAAFELVREKILKIRGIRFATVATNIPVGAENGSNGYSLNGIERNLDFVDVDFDYFETLDIKVKHGRLFSRNFKTDTANSAILNESAAAIFGVKDPIGMIIRGCNIDYKIVGVVKDFKAQGFEMPVSPSIYTIKNPCGNLKVQLMLKIGQEQMTSALASLKAQWPEINKMDGENFRYHFLDQLYANLLVKQERLQAVFFAAAIVTIFIAVLGLFAFAKYMTNNRLKEIAVRKVLGASGIQILKLLNTSFLTIVILANGISWPLAYILAKKWLDTFAYRVDIPILPFIIGALVTILLTIFTVSLQALKAVKTNPVKALKYE